MPNFIFTYGNGHATRAGNSLAYRFTRISAPTEDEARAKMIEKRGLVWATSYQSEADAGVDRWHLTEISLEDAAILPQSGPTYDCSL